MEENKIIERGNRHLEIPSIRKRIIAKVIERAIL